jgi:hypothetical protein
MSSFEQTEKAKEISAAEGGGQYQEETWIEMQEDEDDDINCLGMFDDPGRCFLHDIDLFSCSWQLFFACTTHKGLTLPFSLWLFMLHW